MNMNFKEMESADIVEEMNFYLFNEDKIEADFDHFNRLEQFTFHNHDELLWSNLTRKEKGRKHHKKNIVHKGKYEKGKLKRNSLVNMSRKEFVQSEDSAMNGHPVYYWTFAAKNPESQHPMYKVDRKGYHNRREVTLKSKEKEFLEEMYTGRGDLIHENEDFEETLFNYRKIIDNLEYEKAFGYLNEIGIEHLEELKEETVELEQWIKENIIQYATAVR